MPICCSPHIKTGQLCRLISFSPLSFPSSHSTSSSSSSCSFSFFFFSSSHFLHILLLLLLLFLILFPLCFLFFFSTRGTLPCGSASRVHYVNHDHLRASASSRHAIRCSEERARGITGEPNEKHQAELSTMWNKERLASGTPVARESDAPLPGFRHHNSALRNAEPQQWCLSRRQLNFEPPSHNLTRNFVCPRVFKWKSLCSCMYVCGQEIRSCLDIYMHEWEWGRAEPILARRKARWPPGCACRSATGESGALN